MALFLIVIIPGKNRVSNECSAIIFKLPLQLCMQDQLGKQAWQRIRGITHDSG